MKILIVEDDRNKERQLTEFIQKRLPDAELWQRRSYQSGVKAVLQWLPDIVVLDMTMPTYDVSATEGGGRSRRYAGRDILREIARKRLRSLVIIVTQFEIFGEGELTLGEVRSGLAEQFPDNYVGTVYYNPAHSDWRGELVSALANAGIKL